MWGAAYLAGIVALNAAFLAIPMVRMPWGDLWSVGTLGVGVIYILRDVVQRKYGHSVLFLMALGIAITYLMSPHLALASGAAFATGELVEWLWFTFSGQPFRQRVLWSAIPGVVLDTLVFLALAGFLTPTNFAFEVPCKMVALIWIRWLPDPLAA